MATRAVTALASRPAATGARMMVARGVTMDNDHEILSDYDQQGGRRKIELEDELQGVVSHSRPSARCLRCRARTASSPPTPSPPRALRYPQPQPADDRPSDPKFCRRTATARMDPPLPPSPSLLSFSRSPMHERIFSCTS